MEGEKRIMRGKKKSVNHGSRDNKRRTKGKEITGWDQSLHGTKRHGRVTYHNCSSSLIKSRNGTRGIFTKALKVRVHHKDKVDLKSNYEVHKYNESK